MRWSIEYIGLSSCGCRQVLSFGGVESDDIEADEKRSSEINGEGCLSHPSSRKQADTSLKKKSPFRSQAKTKYLSKFNRVETLQMDNRYIITTNNTTLEIDDVMNLGYKDTTGLVLDKFQNFYKILWSLFRGQNV